MFVCHQSPLLELPLPVQTLDNGLPNRVSELYISLISDACWVAVSSRL